MNINFKILSFALLLIMAMTAAPQAQAQTMSESLTRIDAIIAEMQKLRAEFARLVGVSPTVPAPVAVTSGVVLGAATTPVLTGNLSYGATSDSISRVQKLLATDAEIYADGTVSGFFGPKTQEALRRFQARFGLDTVGIIGPATKAVLEAFMQAYPNENYPAGVLKGAVPKPVAPVVTAPAVTPQPTASATLNTQSIFSAITATGDGEDYDVVVKYVDGRRNVNQVIQTRSEKDVAATIARRLGVTESEVKAVLKVNTRSASSRGGEAKAERVLAEAKADISDARNEIRAADKAGDDVDEAEEMYQEARDLYKEAEQAFEDGDYDDAIELAEEAMDLARDAVRAIE